MSEVIAIFTGKDLDTLQKDGGSGFWKAKQERLIKAEYVILIRNHRESWAVRDVEHGQAFMVGKISGAETSEEYTGRELIKISEYSLLPDTEKFKDSWRRLTDGQRNPVAYLTIDDVLRKLNLDLNDLQWSVFKADVNTQKETVILEDDKELSVVISEAKAAIAHAAGIESDKVNIQISF
jgi:hypothetical protein